MDSHSGEVRRLEVVETGRRRRFSDAEKLRIVEESYAGHRQASATARRHGISRTLLFRWRKAAREGRLGGADATGFVPAVVMPDEGGGSTAPVSAPRGRMEIVVGTGRRVILEGCVDPEALASVIRVLEDA